MLAARDRAETLAGLKAACRVLTGEQAGNDSVFGADAGRDDAPDVIGIRRPAFRANLGMKLVGPDLLAGIPVHETSGELGFARDVARDALQLEARRIARWLS